MKLAVFCSGYGSNFQAILDAERRKKLGARVAVMVCDNPKAVAIRRAKKDGIPTVLVDPKLFKKREDYERLIVRVLKNEKVDVIALAGFMRILTPVFLNAFRGRILNIHPSLLPEFKGAHAIRDAFAARVKTTGATVHVVTKKLDSGPILAQKKVNVSPKDTLKTLEAKIHQAEHKLYPEAIRRFVTHLKKHGNRKEA